VTVELLGRLKAVGAGASAARLLTRIELLLLGLKSLDLLLNLQLPLSVT
jgi:hypothetical protein